MPRTAPAPRPHRGNGSRAQSAESLWRIVRPSTTAWIPKSDGINTLAVVAVKPLTIDTAPAGCGLRAAG